jgi:antitoxin YefM
LYRNTYKDIPEETPMDAITYSHARENLAETMRRVCDDHTPIVITRQKERPVVMISLEDWNAYEETAYLLRSPANAARLRASIAHDQAGDVAAHDQAGDVAAHDLAGE